MPNGPADKTELSPETLRKLAGSLKDQWKRYRKQLRQCQRKVSERGVHDLRVETRRLLSLLHLLSPFLASGRLSKAETALKCHLDAFDDLRDIQVQLIAVRKLRKSFSAAQQFYRFLKKREARFCRSTRKHSRQLRCKPLSRCIAACRQDVRSGQKHADSPNANTLLVGAVTRAFNTAKKFRKNIDRNDPHTIHCTRIAFKKFRYMVEALAGCLKWADKSLLEQMRQYQGMMGDIQDAHVLLLAFERFFRKESLDPKPASKLTHELLRRRQLLITKYIAEADRLNDFWPPLKQTAQIAYRRVVPDASRGLRLNPRGAASPN